MSSKRSWAPSCRLAAIAGALAGCAGADLSAPGVSEPRAPGEVGSERSSLREDTCWTEAPPDKPMSVGMAGQSVETESTGGSYGHPGCLHSWIVEATNTLDKSLLVAGGVLGVEGADQDWCEGFWSEHEARGCSSTPCVWTRLGSWSERAKWRAGKGSSPGTCERVITGTLPELGSDHGFRKVRIVTQAGWVYWYHAAYARVTVP